MADDKGDAADEVRKLRHLIENIVIIAIVVGVMVLLAVLL